jgi:hypothetical protein
MHRLKLQTGSNIVEFAFVMPLLVILVFGIMDFSIGLYNKAVITNAVREGARSGIAFSDNVLRRRINEAEIQNLVAAYCNNKLINFGSSTVEPRAVFTPNGYPPNSGDTLTVDFRTPYIYHYVMISRLFPSLDSLSLNATSVMRVE